MGGPGMGGPGMSGGMGHGGGCGGGGMHHAPSNGSQNGMGGDGARSVGMGGGDGSRGGGRGNGGDLGSGNEFGHGHPFGERGLFGDGRGMVGMHNEQGHDHQGSIDRGQERGGGDHWNSASTVHNYNWGNSSSNGPLKREPHFRIESKEHVAHQHDSNETTGITGNTAGSSPTN